MTVHSKSLQDPFWRPIKEFFPQPGKKYFFWKEGNNLLSMWGAGRKVDREMMNYGPARWNDYFAEVPPVPKLQNEVKP